MVYRKGVGNHSSKKSVCVCVLVVIWVSGMLAMLYNMSDWSSAPDTGSDPNSLFAYQAVTPLQYRQHVSGLNYGRYASGKEGAPEGDVTNPAVFTLRDLLQDWNPDDTEADHWTTSRAHPDQKGNKGGAGGGAVRRFDFQKPEDLRTARKYRVAEMPFIVYNVPELDKGIGKLSLPQLKSNLGHMPRLVEGSKDNHFMYYSSKIGEHPLDMSWRPPQMDLPMTFAKFLRLAEEAEKVPHSGAAPLHYMTIGAGEGLATPWIREALPFFTDSRDDNFFIVDSDGFKGINCRFGMRGVVAEAHYDGGRNFVSMLKGRKRYLLLPPDECDKLRLLPRGHPSARHSSVDWSDMAEVDAADKLGGARATEAMVSSGDILYIPGFWFHYIVSQDTSLQCNARSGNSEKGQDIIEKCMDGHDHESSRKRKKKSKKHKHFDILTESQI